MSTETIPDTVRAIPSGDFCRRWSISRFTFYDCRDAGMPVLTRKVGTQARYWVPVPEADEWMEKNYFQTCGKGEKPVVKRPPSETK